MSFDSYSTCRILKSIWSVWSVSENTVYICSLFHQHPHKFCVSVECSFIQRNMAADWLSLYRQTQQDLHRLVVFILPSANKSSKYVCSQLCQCPCNCDIMFTLLYRAVEWRDCGVLPDLSHISKRKRLIPQPSHGQYNKWGYSLSIFAKASMTETWSPRIAACKGVLLLLDVSCVHAE